MGWGLVILLIIAIPIVAVVDVIAFGKSFEKLYKRPITWKDFIVPSTLEIFCFIAGYILGSGGL